MPRLDGLGTAGGGGVGLGELAGGGGEADLESLGFAGPAFAFGLRRMRAWRSSRISSRRVALGGRRFSGGGIGRAERSWT